MAILDHPLTRRGLIGGTGALVVSFSISRASAQTPASPPSEQPEGLPGSLDDEPFLDSWIRIGGDNSLTVFTGKAELGQGMRTALIQVAAEELDVEPAQIRLITADTGASPNEGFTAGSQSMQNSGTAIRNAAAQVRILLLGEAARQLGAPVENLRTDNRAVTAENARSVTYGELAASLDLHVEAQPQSTFKQPGEFRFMGKSMPRVDIPDKVTGEVAYVQDLRPEGMLHARVVRPPSYGARLAEMDASAIEALPGVVSVVRDGNFLAVVAEKEFQAITAMRALASAARWDETAALPDMARLPEALQALEREVGTVAKTGVDPTFDGKVFEATFTRPYHIHGSIGPSCAIAHMQDDGSLVVWSHTQGVFPDRAAISEMLGMPPDKVRVIHVEGSGCYGHNGADDAAADAALIATKLPGRPVRVQWMREQEHAWEPYGPGMVTKVRASLDESGTITDWAYDLWSNTHSTRPGGAGSLLAGQHKSNPFPQPPATMRITPSGNGDRNAIPLYTIANTNILWHFLPDMPLRVSALRGLGAYANVFSVESTMDELALLAGVDPVEFRLRHMEDPRARKVMETTAERFGWSTNPLPPNRGRGFAFARYKNLAAYLAVAVETEIAPETGRIRVSRAVSAIDSGEIINPDGIRNQTEGGILQSISWTLYEAVTFDRQRITSSDWSSYPVLRFASVPDTVEVHIIDRPGDPFLGTGEAAQGPTSAAVANAVRHATGQRFYDLPLSRDRVKAALGA
jgi:nicotinate dehydrogenase subunit B